MIVSVRRVLLLSINNLKRLGYQDTKLAEIEAIIPTIDAFMSLSIPMASDLRFPGSFVS